MKKELVLMSIGSLLLAGQTMAQGWPSINTSTVVSDMRCGPNLNGPNTGIFKWQTFTNSLGIFTWADAKNIRIGGSLVEFQKENGGINNVFMSGKLGVGILPTTAQVEINSALPASSGLKFTQLNAVSPVTPGNGKVLSVDPSGNVVLVPDLGGAAYTGGNGITISGSNVINSTWTQTGTNISNNNSGNVGIGVAAPTLAKLDVSSANDISLQSVNTKAMSSWGTQIGVFGQADNNLGLGHGGVFYGGNTGAYGQAEGNLDNLLPEQVNSLIFDIKGLRGSAYNYGTWNPRTAMGVYGEGYSDSPNGLAIGLYGYSFNTANSSNSWALYADGDAYSTSGAWTSSDERLKENITNVKNALDIIKQITPSTYTFKKDGHFANTKLPQGKQYGFIAQNLEKVLPELVKDAPIFFNKQDKDNGNDQVENYKAVQYTSLIPILTAAIQEQQSQIEELKQILNSSPEKITDLSNTENGAQQTEVYLSQNVPNPFSGTTEIKYKLPANTMNGLIGIYDMNGKEIKLIELASGVSGSITINGGELQPGMYFYTLIADGKAIDSKKMILTSK